jgi:hypothetical protein
VHTGVIQIGFLRLGIKVFLLSCGFAHAQHPASRMRLSRFTINK